MALPHPFFFAPLAELSTPPMRRCVRSFSSGTVLYSEMLSANQVLHGGLHNRCMIEKNEHDEPFIYQLLGSDPGMMAEAAQKLEAYQPYGIDINMGCSAPEILYAGNGAALLKNADLARSIVRACRSAVKGSLSVKIRAGYEQVDCDFTLAFCRMLAEEGADFIVIHPRAAKQGFRRAADWNIIRHVKEQIFVPVVGNGDIKNAVSAAAKIRDGYCDAVMIARAAVQEPWIFAQCESLYGEINEKSEADILNSALMILDGIRDELPPEIHRSRAHRFLFYYTKNFLYGHELYSKIRNTEDLAVMREAVVSYCARNSQERIRLL